MEQPPDTPRIGVDEWVASVEGKRERYTGLLETSRARAAKRAPNRRRA